MLGHEAEFLPAFAEAHTPHAAAAERGDGLVGLMAFVEFGFLDVQPRVEARRAHGVMHDENRKRSDGEHHRRRDVAPANARQQEHHATHAGEQHGGAHVGLLEDEREHDGDAESGVNNAAPEPSHEALVIFAIPGERDDERDLRKLGGLESEATDAQPATRAVALKADLRHEHEHECADGDEQRRPPKALEPAIIAGCGDEQGNQADSGPDGLHDEILRLRLACAGADQHDDAKHEKGKHGEEKKGGRDFHEQGEFCSRSEEALEKENRGARHKRAPRGTTHTEAG